MNWQHIFAMLFVTSVMGDSATNDTEEVQRIDMINISAFVTDYSDGEFTENVSKVFYEEIDGKLSLDNIQIQIEDYLAVNYYLTVLIHNQDTAEEYAVDEIHSDPDQVSRISIEDPLENVTKVCLFHSSGVGMTINGLRCRKSQNLPEECFCWDGNCSHPYLSFHKIIKMLLGHTDELKQEYQSFYSWNIFNENGVSINATFKLVNNRVFLPIDIFIEDFDNLTRAGKILLDSNIW